MHTVGIDGCKAGWFAVSIFNNEKWEFKLHKSIDDAFNAYANADIILIDIPIGLIESGIQERLCDVEARKLLGPKRGPSVFPVPCRQAIYNTSYHAANNINKKYLSRGLSQQTWGIVQKIREVDIYLNTYQTIIKNLKESHPEICFYAISGQPMKFSKKKKEGSNERLNALRGLYPNTDEIIKYALNSYKRKELAIDDIIDALCLAISGLIGLERGFCKIPKVPEKDPRGLEMQMMFALSNEGVEI